MPAIIKLFFVLDALVLLAALVTRGLESKIWSDITDFFRLSRESNLPTAYSGFQHIVVGLLFGVLAIREVRIDYRRWVIALPSAMFLFFALDEIAMVHERISDHVAYHVHSLKSVGEFTSVPALIFCVPAVIVFAVIAARLSRRYWQGRPRVAGLFVAGLAVFLFAAAGLEALGHLLQNHHALYSLETLLEEGGEMVGVTLVLWSAVELLAAEKLRITWSRDGVRFE